MVKLISFINGVKTLVNSVIESTGVIDAGKIVETDINGNINNSLLSSSIARVTDITNTLRYGKFTGLKSNYYVLGSDINIVPVVGGQSSVQAYWGLQLGGIRPLHRFTTTFVDKDPPEVFTIESLDTFCVGIQAQTTNPNGTFVNTGMGVSKPFSVLNLYSTNWHTNGTFLNCKTSSYASMFFIALNGEIYIQNNKVLGIRNTGWTAGTGTANKGAFDTTTATLQQCAERIKALEDMLRTHGLIN